MSAELLQSARDTLDRIAEYSDYTGAERAFTQVKAMAKATRNLLDVEIVRLSASPQATTTPDAPTPRTDAHPENNCQECGRPNIVWFTPNEIWNKTVGDGGGILCPVCFCKKAEAAGFYRHAWKIEPEGER